MRGDQVKMPFWLGYGAELMKSREEEQILCADQSQQKKTPNQLLTKSSKHWEKSADHEKKITVSVLLQGVILVQVTKGGDFEDFVSNYYCCVSVLITNSVFLWNYCHRVVHGEK